MTQYIDKKSAKRAIAAVNVHNGIVDAMQSLIDDIPAADVQKVVYCRNCKFCIPLDRHSNFAPCYYHCTEWHGEETKNVWHKYKKYYKDYSIVEQDDFCSFGERMEEHACKK